MQPQSISDKGMRGAAGSSCRTPRNKPMQNQIQIIHGDSCKELARLPRNSVHLFVTSPPYGLDIPYDSYVDSQRAWEELMQFWPSAAYKAAAAGARLVVNIPLDTTRPVCRPVYAQTVEWIRQTGWQYRTSIVWNEDNMSKNVARGSVDSCSAPNIIARVEMLAVFYKQQWRLDPPDPAQSAKEQSDLSHQEWLEWTNGLWMFPGETRPFGGHPAPFPIELPRRCIKLFSYPSNTVCDPFCGSGTTLLAAQQLGRKVIGIDVSEHYCKLSSIRVAQQDMFEQLSEKVGIS